MSETKIIRLCTNQALIQNMVDIAIGVLKYYTIVLGFSYQPSSYFAIP